MQEYHHTLSSQLLHPCQLTLKHLSNTHLHINLLLIVCALRCYVKCLYRHIFLEDTSKKARVTQKITLPKLW